MSDDLQHQDDRHAVPDRFSVDFTGLELLGVYRVEKKLAEGGMGSIYLGHDENLGRRVVIKVPHVKFLSEPGFRPRFAREIKELVRLEHRSIVRIIAQGEHEQVPFFVLQYLGGGSLEERMQAAGGPMPPEAFIPWIRTIAATLDFIHGRGTIHRDVKPANILFDEAGHVYLSDFGVAKVLEGEDADLTEAGTGIGSPRYMAPEQGYGKELTSTADQYALASMLYECIAGSPPFTETSPIKLLVEKGSKDPEPLRDRVPQLPGGAADAVMRGLSRDPAARFPSCTALLDAFEAGFAPPQSPTTGAVATGGAAAGRTKISPTVFVAAIAFSAVLAALVWMWTSSVGEDPTVADGATNNLGGIAVTLLDAGAEPRAPLRHAARKGDTHRSVLRFGQGLSWMLGGVPTVMQTSEPAKLEVEVEVVDVAANGDREFAWRVLDVEMPVYGHAAPPSAEVVRRLEALFRTLAGRVVISSNGLVRSSTAPDGNTDDGFAKSNGQTVTRLMRSIAAQFPVEPVGVGARWEVTETGSVMSMRVTNTTQYRLQARDGDRLEINQTVAETASRQPAEIAGMKLTLLELHANGRAEEMVVHLGQVAPRAFDYRMKMVMDYYQGVLAPDEEVPEGANPPRIEVTVEVSVAIEDR